MRFPLYISICCISRLVASALVGLFCMGNMQARAQVCYQENFNNATGINSAPSSVGWSAYYGASGTDISNYSTPVLVGGLGYLAWVPNSSAVGAVKTGLNLSSAGIISWNMNAGGAGDTARLLIQIAGKWYASDKVFTPSFYGDATAFLSATPSQVGFSMVFTTHASAWRNFTLTPGGGLVLGSALSADLPSSPVITGIGFYFTAASGQTLRVDALQIRRFQEDFNNATGINAAPSSAGWSAYYGASGTDISNYSTPVLVGGLGYLAWVPNSSAVGAVKTGLSLSSVGTISWNMNAGGAGDTARLLIQIAGNWYASDEVFIPSFYGDASAFLSATPEQVGFSTVFTTHASAWRNFTLTPGGGLVLGSALSADLPLSSVITGIGFYFTAASGQTLRVDALRVQEPVIFWAHYMPQIPNASLYYSFHGNNIAWPLITEASAVTECKEHIRMAMASGITGFQMLATTTAEMFEAARQVREETGELFYISPEWCTSSLYPATSQYSGAGWADKMADFADKYQDNPHLYRRSGRPEMFTYMSGDWEEIPDEVMAFHARLAERGSNLLLAPTVSLWMLLDRPDVGWGPWPDGPIQPGPVEWLRIGFEGGTAWDMGPDSRAIDAVQTRLQEEAPGFLYLPPVNAGYDSSNRPSQSIRVPFHGLGTLYDGLRFLYDGSGQSEQSGFRQFCCLTWNDCNETMFVPSSANVWGYNTIIRYFRGMFESNSSPLSSPEVVVAFPAECLYGDMLDFQILALPARGETVTVRAHLEWERVGNTGSIVFQGDGEASSEGPNREAFLELDWPSGLALGQYDALQPYLSIDIKRPGSNWYTAYQRLRLPPVTLSYNLVRFPTGYAINLAKVSADSSLALVAADDGGPTRVTVSADASSSIRRLHLDEGTRSLGVFRASSINNSGNTGPWRDLFLRIETSANLPLELGLSQGTIHDLFTPTRITNDTTHGVMSVERENTASFPAYINGAPFWGIGWRSVRIDLERGGQISLSVTGVPTSMINATIPELLQGRKVKSFDYQGQKVTVSLGLTSDGTDASIDYPLSSGGEFSREVPLWPEKEGVEVIHVAALLQSGQMAYSNAVISEGHSASSQELVPAQWIETGGTFDDFVRNGYATSGNPFTPTQVHQTLVARSRIPYFHLDFEEGAGSRLNDRNTEHQAGRAWVELGTGAPHAAGYEQEAGGRYQWLMSGHHGKALQLGADTRIRFRSKSSPVGAQTTSLWVGMSETEGQWARLNAGPFTIKKENATGISTTFQRADCNIAFNGNAAWQPGWNHVVFVYDLGSVRIYVNSQLVAEKSDVPPVYQRTQNAPHISFDANRSVGSGLFFDGRIDEVEVIGTGIAADAVARLWAGTPWRE